MEEIGFQIKFKGSDGGTTVLAFACCLECPIKIAKGINLRIQILICFHEKNLIVLRTKNEQKQKKNRKPEPRKPENQLPGSTTHRKPTTSKRTSGVTPLREAPRTKLGTLTHDPPRSTFLPLSLGPVGLSDGEFA